MTTVTGCSYSQAESQVIADYDRILADKSVVKVSPPTDKRYHYAEKPNYDYFYSYHIPKSTLEHFDVKEITSIYVNGSLDARSTKQNPIFGYPYPSGRMRVYRPTRPSDVKWGGNANGEDVSGIPQLKKRGVICFITSSTKDAMVLHQHGFSAISFNSETFGVRGDTAKIFASVLSLLKLKFRYVVLFLDNDTAGITSANQLGIKYNLKSIVTEEVKDISDYQKRYGVRKTSKKLKTWIKRAFSQ